jgi:hypothetical protein
MLLTCEIPKQLDVVRALLLLREHQNRRLRVALCSLMQKERGLL